LRVGARQHRLPAGSLRADAELAGRSALYRQRVDPLRAVLVDVASIPDRHRLYPGGRQQLSAISNGFGHRLLPRLSLRWLAVGEDAANDVQHLRLCGLRALQREAGARDEEHHWLPVLYEQADGAHRLGDTLPHAGSLDDLRD